MQPWLRKRKKSAITKRWVKKNLERSKAYRHGRVRSPLGRFAFAKNAAKRRGLSWGLAFGEYSILISKPCHYCSGPLCETGVGLDRLDSSGGYDHGNVAPCCRQCNQIKGGNFTEAETKAMVSALIAHRIASNCIEKAIEKHNVSI